MYYVTGNGSVTKTKPHPLSLYVECKTKKEANTKAVEAYEKHIKKLKKYCII